MARLYVGGAARTFARLAEPGKALESWVEIPRAKDGTAAFDVEISSVDEAAWSTGPDTPAARPGAEHNGGMPIRRVPRPGRNDPCPCGSGRKYKGCCKGLEE